MSVESELRLQQVNKGGEGTTELPPRETLQTPTGRGIKCFGRKNLN